jgi:hypothetical protein
MARAAALVPRIVAVLGIAAGIPARAPLAAQTPCRSVPTPSQPEKRGVPDDARGPLARTFSLQAGEVTLRSALDLIAEAARVRLTYSGDLLPLDSRVCATWESATVGGALARLLGDAPIQPVAAGDDHVVLAPARIAFAPHQPAPQPSQPVYHLDEIVAESSVTGSVSRGEPVDRAVVSGKDLESRGVETLAGALATVPGVWTWGGGPDASPRFGSLRGASSFGVSAPKVYVDGIEAASPLLVSRLLPGTIERIEVIRGPQGAGWYGADAIGGVVNVVTRQAGGTSAPRARIQSLLGSSSSLFSPEVGVSQDHTISLRGGSKRRSAGLDFGLGTTGDHVPGAASLHVSAAGSARLVGARSLLDATVRFSSEGSRLPPNPLLSGFGNVPSSTSGEQSLHQYTVGLTGSLTTGRWTHSATAGVDGYALDGAFGLNGALSSAADSALRAATGTSARSTLRLTTVGRFDLEGKNEASLTFTAERSALEQQTAIRTIPTGTPSSPGSMPVAAFDELASSRTGYGLAARADASWGDRFFLNSGVRFEHTDAVVGLGSLTALPMFGAAVVEDRGPFTVKVRAAYGRGIRWPQLAPQPGVPGSVPSDAMLVGLVPEMQSGVEGGLDLSVGDVASLHVTRFDQTARGLVQRVSTTGGGPGRGGRSSYGYRFQNVGAIGNRGWELSGSLRQGPFSLGAALSLVDSRVLRLAEGYTGDLREGDRPLEVPARTLGLTASWNSRGWMASVTANRATDWINYDRLALARDLASSSSVDLTGDRLRGYWRPYDGVTHLNAMLSRDLFGRFTLTVAGENLLGRQLGEPDNITVLPGRTLRVGVRASF